MSMHINTANGVLINGMSKVVNADNIVDNGVVHLVDKVIGLPTIVTIATADTNFSILVSALTRDDQPDFVTTLSTANGTNPAPFTVFAPTNAAFTQLLSALSLTDMNNIAMPTLLAVLRYHVRAGRAFSSDLANGTLGMLAGGNTTINLTNGTGGGPTITGNGNGANRSNIAATNIVCRNGVVHLIDRVLLP